MTRKDRKLYSGVPKREAERVKIRAAVESFWAIGALPPPSGFAKAVVAEALAEMRQVLGPVGRSRLRTYVTRFKDEYQRIRDLLQDIRDHETSQSGATPATVSTLTVSVVASAARSALTGTIPHAAAVAAGKAVLVDAAGDAVPEDAGDPRSILAQIPGQERTLDEARKSFGFFANRRISDGGGGRYR